MRRESLEACLPVDEALCHPSGQCVRIDLVVLDIVPLTLELDGTEQELRRRSPGARIVKACKTTGKMNERDPHRVPRLTAALRTAARLPCAAMHRQRTKLASRVTRVASSIERRGIVATYEIHDRLLGNRSARKRFTADRPALDDVQRGIVDALDREGYVTLPFSDLVGEDAWKAVESQGASFVAETERTLAEGGTGKVRAGKEFVSRAYSFEGTTLGADNAWFTASASRRMLDVANAYLRLSAKLSYVDLWYTAQQPPTEERVASQNWHVDFDDKHLLKAFVYLSDVGVDHGPFEYVPGSQPGGRHHTVRPWVPMGYGRVADEDVSRNVPAEEIATFTGSQGTLILCNTSGLHRGGFATAGPRILATATYCSPASLKALSNRNYESTLDSDDPVVRYALS